MAIENNLCLGCVHAGICKFEDYIQKFSEDNKKPMGIDVQMLRCSSYEKDE